MSIDLDYYINVYDLMRIDLPRPTPRNTKLFDVDGVEIPLILVEAEEWISLSSSLELLLW